MDIISIFMIAIGLSADAFAVSVCKGLELHKIHIKDALIVAAYFGVFQALMPLIGFVLGAQFGDFVNAIDHWIAFLLLTYIGANLIKEGISNEEGSSKAGLSAKIMVPLAISTSIDALAVGITFAFFNVKIILAILVIGVVTFVCCLVGVKIGNIFGLKYKSKAEIVGGVILILIAFNILLPSL